MGTSLETDVPFPCCFRTEPCLVSAGKPADQAYWFSAPSRSLKTRFEILRHQIIRKRERVWFSIYQRRREKRNISCHRSVLSEITPLPHNCSSDECRENAIYVSFQDDMPISSPDVRPACLIIAERLVKKQKLRLQRKGTYQGCPLAHSTG